MVVLTSIEVVRKLVSGYMGYRKDKIKEDDLLVRKRLGSEILKAQEHSKNILELLYEKDNTDGMNALKKVKDELDVFYSEIELSPVGHQYSFLDPKKSTRSPTESTLKKLVDFDAGMLDSLVNVTLSMGMIEDYIIDEKNVNYQKELAKIRSNITKSRNNYRDREDFLRRWK